MDPHQSLSGPSLREILAACASALLTAMLLTAVHEMGREGLDARTGVLTSTRPVLDEPLGGASLIVDESPGSASPSVESAPIASESAAAPSWPSSVPAAPSPSSLPALGTALSLPQDTDADAAAADAAWLAEVGRNAWDGVDPSSPSLCVNAQRGLVPAPDAPYGKCNNDPAYAGLESPGWAGLTDRLLAVDCIFSPSPTTERRVLTLPPRNASVYVVFVLAPPLVGGPQAVLVPPPYETLAARAVRRALTSATLRELRRQFGPDALEVTVVQLDDAGLDEVKDLGGPGAVNTLVYGTWREGQDWGMYQDGIHAAWRRLAGFEWVLVLNDQMVGPVAHLPDTLALASRAHAALWITSSMRGCCVRGFAMGFSRELVASDTWRHFWGRIAFPCGKMGPMILGEGGISRHHALGWHHVGGGCAASSAGTIGKMFSLEQQRSEAPSTAFLYRWGIESKFLPDLAELVTEADALPGIRAALEYLRSTARIAAVVEDCAIDGSGPRVQRAEMPMRPGDAPPPLPAVLVI